MQISFYLEGKIDIIRQQAAKTNNKLLGWHYHGCLERLDQYRSIVIRALVALEIDNGITDGTVAKTASKFNVDKGFGYVLIVEIADRSVLCQEVLGFRWRIAIENDRVQGGGHANAIKSDFVNDGIRNTRKLVISMVVIGEKKLNIETDRNWERELA